MEEPIIDNIVTTNISIRGPQSQLEAIKTLITSVAKQIGVSETDNHYLNIPIGMLMNALVGAPMHIGMLKEVEDVGNCFLRLMVEMKDSKPLCDALAQCFEDVSVHQPRRLILIHQRKITELCKQRIRQIVRYQDADLMDELEGKTIKRVPLITSYTVTHKGAKIECKDLLLADDNLTIYCLPVNGETSERIDISDLFGSDRKLIADTIAADIQKTEEWADNFFG